MVIHRKDRVRTLIQKDERLIEVLADLSPVLERLRNPITRNVMSSLMTVEQAAQMAGLDPDALVERLNDETAGEVRADAPAGSQESRGSESHQMPATLRTIPSEKVVHLDVREDLRAGREPFSRIMAARKDVPGKGALCVRAIFEPIPLYAVMQRQGFTHHTERLAEDDWRVWFYAPGEGGSVGPGEGAGAEIRVPDESAGDDVQVLDVRGMEPPEPLVRTLAALEALPDGWTLVQLNVRVPEFLLPQLEERGFSYEIREQSEHLVRVFIRRVRGAGRDLPSTTRTGSHG